MSLSAPKASNLLNQVGDRIDVNTAFLHDRVPRFPIPDDILPRINTQPLISDSNRTLLDACITEDMTSTVLDLLILNQFMVSELAIRDLWDDGVFAGLHVMPLISKLLSFRHDTHEYILTFARQESCRIGALLYLSGVRCRYGVSLSTAVYIPKLKDVIITQDNSSFDPTDPVLLWVVFIGGVKSLVHAEHNWFVSTAAQIIVRQQWTLWDELMAVIREVLWIEGVLEVECHEFRREVSAELWSSYGHLFS